MSFTNLMTNKVVIARLTAVSGDKTHYQTITSDYVSIHRMDDRKAVAIGGAIGKTYRLYADETADIQKGDRLEDEDYNEYKVLSVTIPSELGNFVHMEAVIVRVP